MDVGARAGEEVYFWKEGWVLNCKRDLFYYVLSYSVIMVYFMCTALIEFDILGSDFLMGLRY